MRGTGCRRCCRSLQVEHAKIEQIWFEAAPEAGVERESNPRFSRQALPNNLWVRIHADEGLAGLGRTYPAARGQRDHSRGPCAVADRA